MLNQLVKNLRGLMVPSTSQNLCDEVLEHQVYTNGDIAYSISRSKTQGKYKGKDIKSMGMESITLKNTDTGWKITHIHWSN